jgi:enoyl-CoA hydratase/carnithine racemase
MSTPVPEQILTEVRDGVLLLTLHRPERLNAWTPQMHVELMAAIVAAETDPDVGAVVITGSGRGFCAGADFEATFDQRLGGDRSAVLPPTDRDWVQLIRATKPVVAAFNGPAIGLGVSLMLPCDRLIASSEARFSLRFVKVGLVPELCSSHFLPNRVGLGAASDLMLSGRTIDAHRALELGLVDELVEPDALLETALARAREYGENPAPQLRWIKELLTQNAQETDLSVVQRRELAYLERAYATEEHQAAVRSFLGAKGRS